MRFYKYQGAGNDFILIDEQEERVAEREKAPLSRDLCDRHFGVGGDGLLFISGSDTADVGMRIFNPDGSEAEMCGNGIRCLAKHAYDRGRVKEKSFMVETPAGMKEIELEVEDGKAKYVKVDMGKPHFERDRIPAVGEGKLIDEELDLGDEKLRISAVNTGVPHAVVLVDDVEEADVEELGRRIRQNALFPKGANVNFLQKTDGRSFKVRTYERGVEAETLACGTGIVACGAVAVALGEAKGGGEIEVLARGGKLRVEVVKEGDRISGLYLWGPAEFVFEGIL